MTREEFIAGYMDRSGIAPYTVKGECVLFEGYSMRVRPCDCREEGCEGWQADVPIAVKDDLAAPQ